MLKKYFSLAQITIMIGIVNHMEMSLIVCLVWFQLLLSCVLQMACQSRDLDCLRSLQVELWPSLSAEQNQLLHLVLQELSQPAGDS